MKYTAWVGPATVEIGTDEVAPVVSIDYAVRVQHWYYLENERLTEKFGFFVIFL